MIGQTISHYKILERLGGGGMGIVYKAEDTRLKRTVALKFLPPELTRDPEAKARFTHEARAASGLDHSNICNIHEIDETTDGRIFIVMACYDGEAVRTKITRGPLKLDEALDLAMQTARGLAKAHAEGMVHRDIKPANVMVTSDGVAKIVDFGLARLTGMTRLTQTGATMGTVAYMSPEQTRGETVDHRTDIWSLGVMLYEMVTGQLPFKGDFENAVIYSILNAEPEPMTALRTGVPMELEQIAQKAMAKDPSERYQHADEMLVDLRHVSKQGGSPTATTAPVREMKPRWKRITLYAAMILGLATAFALLRPILFDTILVSEPKPIAVVTFVNQTGDKAYDYLGEAIPNLLITSLEQSRYLRVMTWERMRDLLAQMGKKDVTAIDKELGFELCRREGIHAIVVGSFVKAGETFATDVKVLDVETKELLKTASARGEGVQSILDSQIDELSKEIARGVGLSQRRIESTPSQIAEVTTSSMEAYNYFLRGRDDLDKMYYRQARQFLERAVAMDSTFALAYLYLSKTYGAIVEPVAQVRALEKAKKLSSRAPEKERLYIEARYASVIERNAPKQLALYEELISKYPKEKRFHLYLASLYRLRGRFREAQQECETALQLDPAFAIAANELAYVFADQGLYEQAIEAYQRYASLSPGDANPFDSMAELYLRMGRLDESVARYREALRVKPDFYNSYRSLAYVYSLKEEYPEASRCIDTLVNAAPSVFLKAEGRLWGATYAGLAGRHRERASNISRVEEMVRQADAPQLMSPVFWTRAWEAIRLGKEHEARQLVMAFSGAYSRDNPRTPFYNTALRDVMFCYSDIQADRTDSARARMMLVLQNVDSLEVVTGTRGTFRLLLAAIQGELLLQEHLPDSAIQVIRRTPVPGPAMSVSWRMPMYITPSSRDIVPRSFQMKGMPDSAIAEYERMLKVNPASLDRRLINPLYHYRLAKLCEQTGKIEKARAEYRRFLDIWKAADRDLPEYIDAGKKLKKLGG